MSKLDQIKALGAAKRDARKNTSEASGTARKASCGKAVSASAPMTKPSRNSVRASPHPVAKATKAKPSGLGAKGLSKTPSRLGAGRTAQDSPRSEAAGAVAIQKRGRPRDPAAASRATLYRRRAEGKAK